VEANLSKLPATPDAGTRALAIAIDQAMLELLADLAEQISAEGELGDFTMTRLGRALAVAGTRLDKRMGSGA